MNDYQTFIFESFNFNRDSRTLSLDYSFDGVLNFTETYKFNFEFTNYDGSALDKACQLVFFIAGISYYKAYFAPQIIVKSGKIDEQLSGFLSRTYQEGLGEFFYVNSLDPNQTIKFPVNSVAATPTVTQSSGILIGIGGGKDSLLSTELLRDQVGISTWSLGHRNQLGPLVDKIGLPHYWVERKIDDKLLEANEKGALNGHIPISAILACVGTVVAILSGRQDVIVSNESSASEPTLQYRGKWINHQYSKSLEFETAFQQILKPRFGESVRYYSLLRPLSELRIAELFANSGFDKYHGLFSSCNKAFTQQSPGLLWDGKCPKCAFVFLALTPFVDRQKLEELFHGRNLLLDPELEKTYRNLLGIEGEKPLECVGEIKESRSAMEAAKQQYPELEKYKYSLPNDYDYRKLTGHSMPSEIWDLVKSSIPGSS